jgi:hypothetical protein
LYFLSPLISFLFYLYLIVDSSIRPAILNESDLFLSDDAVEQIVDQVQRIQMKCYFLFISFTKSCRRFHVDSCGARSVHTMRWPTHGFMLTSV